jgi:hypothetical protein
MFEQKKTKQIEQKIISLQAQSGKLGPCDSPEFKQLLNSISRDKRTQDEIFESLKNRIKRDTGGELDDAQAIEATRNLLNFFETLLGFRSIKPLNDVDKQRVNGNVPMDKI